MDSHRSNEAEEKTVRAFVAIELPTDIIAALGRLQDQLKEYGFPAKWTYPGTIHLTLKFLGNIPVSHIGAIGDRMAAAAAGSAPMELLARSVGVFPGIRRPRVLWTGVGGETDLLGRLQQDVEDRFEELGYQRENRRFAGHFTLARFKGRVDTDAILPAIERFGGFATDPFTADAVHLFRSRLSPKGAVYTKLISHRLGGGII